MSDYQADVLKHLKEAGINTDDVNDLYGLHAALTKDRDYDENGVGKITVSHPDPTAPAPREPWTPDGSKLVNLGEGKYGVQDADDSVHYIHGQSGTGYENTRSPDIDAYGARLAKAYRANQKIAHAELNFDIPTMDYDRSAMPQNAATILPPTGRSSNVDTSGMREPPPPQPVDHPYTRAIYQGLNEGFGGAPKYLIDSARSIGERDPNKAKQRGEYENIEADREAARQNAEDNERAAKEHPIVAGAANLVPDVAQALTTGGIGADLAEGVGRRAFGSIAKKEAEGLALKDVAETEAKNYLGSGMSKREYLDSRIESRVARLREHPDANLTPEQIADRELQRNLQIARENAQPWQSGPGVHQPTEMANTELAPTKPGKPRVNFAIPDQDNAAELAGAATPGVADISSQNSSWARQGQMERNAFWLKYHAKFPKATRADSDESFTNGEMDRAGNPVETSSANGAGIKANYDWSGTAGDTVPGVANTNASYEERLRAALEAEPNLLKKGQRRAPLRDEVVHHKGREPFIAQDGADFSTAPGTKPNAVDGNGFEMPVVHDNPGDAQPGPFVMGPTASYEERLRAALEAEPSLLKKDPKKAATRAERELDKLGEGQQATARPSNALGADFDENGAGKVQITGRGEGQQDVARRTLDAEASQAQKQNAPLIPDITGGAKGAAEAAARNLPNVQQSIEAVPGYVARGAQAAAADPRAFAGRVAQSAAQMGAGVLKYASPVSGIGTNAMGLSTLAEGQKAQAQQAQQGAAGPTGPLVDSRHASPDQGFRLPPAQRVPATEVALTNPERQKGLALSGYRGEHAMLDEGAAQGAAKTAEGEALEDNSREFRRMGAEAEQREAARQKTLQDFNAKLERQANQIASDKIDPVRYWKNAESGQVAFNALALIAGGFSAGLRGGPNYAAEQINKAIDRDIDAQKADMVNKKARVDLGHNQLAEYRLMFGDMRTAEAAVRADKISAMKAWTDAQIAKSQDPVFRAHAAVESAKYGMQLQIELAKMNKWVPEHMVQRGLVDADQDRFVPRAGGVARDKSRAEAMRKAGGAYARVDKLLAEAQQLRASGMPLPGTAERARLQGLQKEIDTGIQELNEYRRLSGEDVKVNEGMAGQLDQVWNGSQADATIKNLRRHLGNQEDDMYGSEGMESAREIYDPTTGAPRTILLGHKRPSASGAGKAPNTDFTPPGQ